MAEAEGGPEMVSFRELARRLVADGVVERMSHQRVSQLSREDPAFPPVVEIGRSKAVDWKLAAPYFRKRKPRQGQRTDLKRQQGSDSSSTAEGAVGQENRKSKEPPSQE